MTAGKDTLVQVNFKTPRGTLINVYGDDEQSFDFGLAILVDRIAQLAEIEQQLSGAGAVAEQITLAPVQPPAAAGFTEPAPQAPPAASWGAPAAPAAFTQGATRQCVHGAMVARSGSGAKGPWKGWFCPTPKGTPDQCKAQFLNRGTPEFDMHPA